ncbi:hypothetical protein [Thalassotalea piscium]|uniref:Uncharacterized protein n=1 Tax=Thalassotalea piscium TaxID=1230533 RepID=A0A7X0NEA7_9GAMM|nr:hypothetical protein [Thalassotalea piscium]MBB6541852.1 hypothetical protein [Thalassotalea piscium]
MLTSIILALSVSATPATPVDSLDLLQQENENIASSEVVARKHVRVVRKHVRVVRKHVRVEDNNSAVTTSL